ncbi:MAG: AEC family transporter [Eubacteriales bacterium]|nr:AEC family transporter [Eubacteriales bacterium]
MPAATHQILVIFIALAAGFVCRKLKVITEEGTSTLSGIVVKVILPFYLFNAIASSDAGVDASGVGIAIALSAAMFAVCGLVGLIFVTVFKPSKDDRGVYIFELLCANVTYIGIPVCGAVFGSNAAFYASLLNIPYNLVCFSLGIYILSGKLSFKTALNPAFLSGVLGSLFFIFKIPLPSVVSDACAFIGQATSPCAMLVVGSVLGSVAIRDVFGQWRAIPYTVIRLFGTAALVLLLTKPLNIDPTLRGVLVLMAAMPAATNSTMLCSIYGGSRELSAKLIFISTALSVISIPLWASFFN